MSVANNSERGNRYNMPYQLAVLQLLDQINNSISVIPGIDYETRTTMYQATADGAGYSTGNIIVRYDIIDVATSTVISTVWFNQTTQATIAAPAPGNLTPYTPGGNVTVTNPFNLEATQQLIKTNTDNLQIFRNSLIDSFGRFRTSSPTTSFDSKMIADNQPLYWDDQQTSGAGTTSTYNANQASVTLGVGASTAGTRVRQTFRRFTYQPGKSQLIFLTGTFNAAATGITRRIGYFDNSNGLFFQQTSAGMSVVQRSFTSGVAVNTTVLQSSWNIDRMDGTGSSGINLDFTYALIMFIEFEWLGVGNSKFGFVVNNNLYYCHQFFNSNTLPIVYMSTPNLPLRYEISNDGTGVASTLVQICSTVISEGGEKDTGSIFGLTRGSTPITTLNNSNIYPIISIRLKSTHLGSAVRVAITNVVCTTNSTFNWYLLLNPVVTGTALNFTNVPNTSIEADVSSTNATTVSGGTVLATGTSLQTNNSNVEAFLPNDFILGSNIAGTSDIVVLAIQRATGTTETFYASLDIKDFQ